MNAKSKFLIENDSVGPNQFMVYKPIYIIIYGNTKLCRQRRIFNQIILAT